MRWSTSCVMGTLIAVVVVSCQSMAAPIQWDGNDHYYDLVFPDPLVNWDTASDAAASSTFLGVSGHLATITSPEEDAFLQENFAGALGDGWAFIGLTDENIEGQYEWVTGEPFSYSNWRPGEPNNLTHGGAYPEGEDYIHYQQIVEPWGWNDAVNNAAFGYFVEYPVPDFEGLGSNSNDILPGGGLGGPLGGLGSRLGGIGIPLGGMGSPFGFPMGGMGFRAFAIPEPSAFLLFCIGVVCVVGWQRRTSH